MKKRGVDAKEAQQPAPAARALKTYVLTGCYDEGPEKSFTRVFRAPSAEAVAEHIKAHIAGEEPGDGLLMFFSTMRPYVEAVGDDEAAIQAFVRGQTAAELLAMVESSYTDGDSSMGVRIMEFGDEEIVVVNQ